jgi:SAM-dependent methyltransferase
MRIARHTASTQEYSMAESTAKAFDLSQVDEAEHLIPRPFGTLQTLNLDHLHRYALAKSFCYNANVLDAAMGCGYSSLVLNCRHYTGVDIDANMVAFANENYRPVMSNATFLQGSVLDLKVETGTIDTFISFETIEHLPLAEIAKYFAEVKRTLKPGGLFLCSTPIYRGDATGLLTKYHHFEFRYGQFEATLLSNGFQLLQTWYQWPPYYTMQSLIPAAAQTQQTAPFIVVCLCRSPG